MTEPLTEEHVRKALRWVEGVPPAKRMLPDDVDLFKDAERLAQEWLAQRARLRDVEEIDRRLCRVNVSLTEENAALRDIAAEACSKMDEVAATLGRCPLCDEKAKHAEHCPVRRLGEMGARALPPPEPLP